MNTIENPMVIDRPRIPHPFERPIEWVPVKRCGCGCGQDADIGYDFDGEMFATRNCIVNMMISEGWVKEVG